MGDLTTNEDKTQLRPRHPGGRPTLYSDAIADVICDALRDGASPKAAAGIAGIGRATLFQWMQQREEFADRVLRARAEAEKRYSDCLLRAAEGDPSYTGDYRAAEAALKRQFATSGWGDTLTANQIPAEQMMAYYVAQVQEQAITEDGAPALLPGDDLL